MCVALAFAPDRERSKSFELPDPVPAVEVEEIARPVPEERELATTPRAVPEVETPVKENEVPVASSAVADISPPERVKSPSVIT